jgi:NADPH:quinone reductase
VPRPAHLLQGHGKIDFVKQIVVNEPGGPEQMTLVDAPKPTPGPGQVLVAIAVSGVNFLDVYFRSGLYKSERPIALGSEAAGTVESVGSGVTDLAVGDRVAYTMVRGSYAEYAIVPALQLVKIPRPPPPSCCRARPLTT